MVRAVRLPKPNDSSKAVQAFKLAAEAFVRKAAASPEAAHKALMDMGIQDKKGNLTRRYR